MISVIVVYFLILCRGLDFLLSYFFCVVSGVFCHFWYLVLLPGKFFESYFTLEKDVYPRSDRAEIRGLGKKWHAAYCAVSDFGFAFWICPSIFSFRCDPDGTNKS